jgi:phosphohistidine phosphatase
MKTVYIARHSHTEEGGFFTKDIHRKLTTQGHTDAKMMAERLLGHTNNIDTIITSNATRALQTAEIYAATLKAPLVEIPALYNASYQAIQQAIEQMDNDVHTILLVAHNPGVTNYINSLEIVALDNMPTAGIFGFESAVLSWADLHNNETQYCYFSYPSL